MQIVQVLATVLMFLVLIVGIRKKYDPPMLLMLVGLVVTAIIMRVTGTDVMGDQTSGNFLIDLFELIRVRFVSTLSGNGILTMSIMGFVMYMTHIKAADMFAAVVTKPLKKIKSKYVVLGGALFIMMLVSLVIPAASSRATLFMATVYPVLLSIGLPRTTAAATILFSTCWHMGPGSHMNATAYSVLDTGFSLVEHFTKHELIILPAVLILLVIGFVFIQRFYDKRENAAPEENTVKEASELDVPKYYALFPILPLVFVLLFSDLAISSVTISVPAANYLAFFIAFFIHLLNNRKKLLETFNTAKEFWVGMGQCMIQIVCLMTAASIFSSALVSIGGMQVIMDAVLSGSSNTTLIIGGIIAAGMFFITIAVTGSASGHIPLYGSMLSSMTSGTQLDKLVVLLITGGNFGAAMAPTAGLTVITAAYSNVEIPTLLKRTMLPSILAFILVSIAVGIAL